MPREKSIKYCPRCDRELPVSEFDQRPRINGRSNGFRPLCRECNHTRVDKHAQAREGLEGPNPSGLCMCGCGQKTVIAKQSHVFTGDVCGTPKRYVRGHGSVKDPYSPDHYTVNQETGCWEWNGSHVGKGYGRVGHRGRHEMAHRTLYKKYKGEIPDGLQLDHLCRNRCCVNPDHLEPVTLIENLRRGSGTILNIEKVLEIRRLWKTGKYTRPQLGKQFGIASTTVEMVVYRHSWKDVEDVA